jgi:hypothetical protein
MPDPDAQYAVVPVPEPGPLRDAILSNAAFVGGPLSYIVAGLSGQEELHTLRRRLDAAAAQQQANAAREQRELAAAVDAVMDTIDRMAGRIDALTQSRAERQRLDALSEATERELELPKDALDPDAPIDPDPPPNASRDAADDQGDLPEALKRGAPPGSANRERRCCR